MKLRFFYYIRIELEILGKNQLFRLQEQQTEPDTKPTECEDQRQSSSGAVTATSPSPAPHRGELWGRDGHSRVCSGAAAQARAVTAAGRALGRGCPGEGTALLPPRAGTAGFRPGALV